MVVAVVEMVEVKVKVVDMEWGFTSVQQFLAKIWN